MTETRRDEPQERELTGQLFEEVGETVIDATSAGAAPVGARSSLWSDAWRQLRRDPLFVASAVLVIVVTVMALAPHLFTFWMGEDCAAPSRITGEQCWRDPDYAELSRSAERPSAQHPFGFDIQGRDQFTRVVYGAKNSMAIGLSVTIGAVLIAVALGSLAGYVGGWIDAIIARFADIFFAIPVTLAGIAFLNILPNRGILEVSAVLMAFGWPTMMRIARSSVLSEKEREYVLAARALGAGNRRIIFRHILPNSFAPVIVYATIFIGVIIGAEATLSFLGVGLQLPAISWGLMVSEAQTRVLQAPHLLLFPGLFISVTVFSFILMGDALRDALDPRLR